MADVRVIVDGLDTRVVLGDSGPQGPRGSQLLSGNINPSISIGLIGDQYINTDTAYLFGPKTSSGWGAGVPILGSSPEDLGQVYAQSLPSTVWDIVHTLSFIPNVIIVDPQGNVIEGAYEYISASHIRATFSNSISGSAYLS